jgi:hypothetical protein
VQVFFSDNASDDGTAKAARECDGDLDLTVRTTHLLKAGQHFVSAGRWALEAEPDAPVFAFLAGDDTWSSGFVSAATDQLRRSPSVDVIFPAFVWESIEEERWLAPVAFRQHTPAARQRRALFLSDRRELANLVYGVFRREAFEDLLVAWERGGESFAADYAAAWSILADHRVEACAAAVGRRQVRPDVDLLERVGLRRSDARGPIATMGMYVRLNWQVNRLTALAIARTVPTGHGPPSWQVQLIRAPQWLWGAVRQVRVAGRSRRVIR